MPRRTPQRTEDRINGPPQPSEGHDGRTGEPDRQVESEAWWQDRRLMASAASGALLAGGYGAVLAGAAGPYPNLVFAAAVVVGGWYFARDAIGELWRERHIGIELLMAVAAVGAMALGKFSQAGVLAFLYSIAEALEERTFERTRHAIRALMDLAPKQATVLRGGEETTVPLEALQVGDLVLVRPGERIPADGVVREGSSAVDESAITGESVPVDKTPGDDVLAGTINGPGVLIVEARATWDDTMLAKIIHLVERAQSEKGRVQQTVERFARYYSPAVLGVSAAVMVVPALFVGDWAGWAIRGVTLLVAASPCALAISTPVTMVAAIGAAARQGILIKGGAYLEALARTKAIAFDKTRTLTLGRPQVVEVIAADGAPAEDVLRWAASVERFSEHPLARAIVTRATDLGLELPVVSDFRSLTGLGAEASADGRRWYVGSAELFERKGILNPLAEQVAELQRQGRTVVLVGTDAGVAGLIALQDELRPEAAQCMSALHAIGITHILMLTGDSADVAAAVAQELGIDEVLARLKPDEKVRVVGEHKERFGGVVMVGDGINDGPALAAATVGIAIGAAGTDVALETADVALMTDDLRRIPDAIVLARAAAAVIRQNIALSLATVVVMSVFALTGALSLAAAVLGHEASELLVVINGLRLLRPPKARAASGR